MAAQVGAQVLTKGPLSTALGQYVFIGLGTFALFTGDNGVSKACQEIANVAFRLVTGRDSLPSTSTLFREAALGANSSQHLQSNNQNQQQQPIVIHSHAAPNSKYGSWTTLIIQVGVGSGACWMAYILFSNYLPEQIKELMPVTRRFFENAVTSLGQGIIKVRDALTEQIAVISGKQDELSAKQDETHGSVLGLKDDIGDVRLHIDDIAVAISRCEGSLTDAAGRQTYMSQGVRLLVQCVGDLLRPGNPKVAQELDQFSRLSSEMMESDDFYYKEGRGRAQLEYPSSPNLSEIGSTTSQAIEEHNRRHTPHATDTPPSQHISGMRPLSLPRPRRSQSSSMVTPRDHTYNTPASTSKLGVLGMNQSPVPTASRAMKMLQSFNKSTSKCDSTVTTAATSSTRSSFMRSISSPEDDVQLSNYHDSSGNISPSSDGTDPVKLSEVEDLLRNVRSGCVPVGV